MLKQVFKMAWSAIKSNKMRSALTMLGITIGVVSLVVVVSLVNGATEKVNNEISALGSNMLTVTVDGDSDGTQYRVATLEELANESDSIAQISPISIASIVVERNGDSVNVNATGTNSYCDDVYGLSLESGRFFGLFELENNSNVIVLDSVLADELFENEYAVGKSVKVNGMTFEVIGVLASSQSTNSGSAMGMFKNYSAYIPITTLQTITTVSKDISTFYVSSTGNLDDSEIYLESVLLSRFGEDNYYISKVEAISQTTDNVDSIFQILMAGLAGISLLVGGIGIMNIMLVSVTERTKEIGIRKAIGAEDWNILMQFLLEALILSLIGCLIGLIVAVLTIAIINVMSDVVYQISYTMSAVAFLFSIAIGVIFGLYPAKKASDKAPIDALRFSN